jgi:predicted SnoaL-like aldol condensation-catalyzing enzyme
MTVAPCSKSEDFSERDIFTFYTRDATNLCWMFGAVFRKFFSGRCGCLVEHWDVLQNEATKSESKSGLPMFGDAFAG